MDKQTRQLFEITPLEIIAHNANRQLFYEREKSKIAVDGIKKIIAQAVNSTSGDWNPEIEKVCASIIIEAENVLRDIDGRKQIKGAARFRVSGPTLVWQLRRRTVQWAERVWNLCKVPVQSLKAHRRNAPTVNQ